MHISNLGMSLHFFGAFFCAQKERDSRLGHCGQTCCCVLQQVMLTLFGQDVGTQVKIWLSHVENVLIIEDRGIVDIPFSSVLNVTLQLYIIKDLS